MNYKKNSVLLFLWVIFSSAHFLYADGPVSLKKTQVAFYISGDDLKKQKNEELKEIWFFKADGTYAAYLEGDSYSGDYSYRLLGSQQEAHLVLTYSDHQGQNIFHVELFYDTPSSGRWRGLQKAEPYLSRYQRGDFEIINQKKAHALIKKL